jgi:ribosome modulation factor
MGRPKGSKNKPKDNEEAPAAGHNSALSEAEKQALFVRGLADLESLIEEKNEVVADIRNNRKRIVSYGFEPWEIDYALRLRKDTDNEAVDRRRKEAQIARFLNHPIGTQPDMLEELDRTPAVDKAFADGRVAGAGGKTAQPPYATGTEQEQSWLKGWHAGQADVVSGFKKLEPAEASTQVEMEEA